MELIRLSVENGNWKKLSDNWENECDKYGENFSDFSPTYIESFKKTASESQQNNNGVFGLQDDGGTFLFTCYLTYSFLSGYNGKVLRVRDILTAPYYALSNKVTTNDYREILRKLFISSMTLSYDGMEAKHVKFHCTTPLEKEFFTEIAEAISTLDHIGVAKMTGSWLYISRK